jgi:hypothetical protein
VKRSASVVTLVLSFALFALSAVPASSLSFVFTPSRVAWFGGEWTSAAIVDGHYYLGANWRPSDCKIGPFPEVQVPAYGAATVERLERLQCPEPADATAGVIPGDPAAEIVTRAVHSSGLVLYVPQARHPLVNFGDEVRAGGLQNSGENRSYVLAYNEGTRGGTITVIVQGADGREVAREWVKIGPRSLVFVPIATPFAAGSAIVKPGLLVAPGGIGFPGANSPESAPSGPVWGWVTSGPDGPRSAPQVIPWTPTVYAPPPFGPARP